ncbi:MAG TPA: LacI family DNA-binding transcriptional regulator [Parafilimonas sp.]|nr:LacI family DNA-binding transcriptional regulator [Parafilimonas sp.]
MKNKVATIKEIAKQLNISPSSVSRALHDHPSIGLRTKMRVQELAQQLNYEPNKIAIFFKQRKTFAIGVVLPNLKEQFFSNAISGIEDVAIKNKYNVFIGQSHDDVEREMQIITAMKEQRVDGIIISLAKHTKNYDHLTALNKYDIPVVFFDRVPPLKNVNRVYYNMVEGTKQALEFLIAKGHRRIGVINGPDEMKSSKERTDAYKEVMIKQRLKIDMSLVVSTDLTVESTRVALDELLSAKPRPTAILAINDYVALDAMQYAKKLKLKINKDICFVSYANLPITSFLLNPPMASVEQHPYLQGSKAAEILMDILNDQKDEKDGDNYRDIMLSGDLIIHTK